MEKYEYAYRFRFRVFLEKKETKSVISLKTLKVGQSKHDKILL